MQCGAGVEQSNTSWAYKVAESRVSACEGSLQDIEVHCLVFCKRVVVAEPKINQNLRIKKEHSTVRIGCEPCVSVIFGWHTVSSNTHIKACIDIVHT